MSADKKVVQQIVVTLAQAAVEFLKREQPEAVTLHVPIDRVDIPRQREMGYVMDANPHGWAEATPVATEGSYEPSLGPVHSDSHRFMLRLSALAEELCEAKKESLGNLGAYDVLGSTLRSLFCSDATEEMLENEAGYYQEQPERTNDGDWRISIFKADPSLDNA